MKSFVPILLVLALAGPAPAQAQSQVTRGRQIAIRDCGGCHSVGPRGESPLSLAPPFRRLNERYDPGDLAESLAEGISVGHPAMPQTAYPPDAVAALVAYLRSLQPMRPHVGKP